MLLECLGTKGGHHVGAFIVSYDPIVVAPYLQKDDKIQLFAGGTGSGPCAPSLGS
jgi:hypothetical protein